MGRKKIDNRIRTLIENGVETGHRSLFVIVGEKARDQVVILHHMLSKATVKARLTVLWCYKKELGFSSHRKKRMRALQKQVMHGQMNADENDPFELFVASTKIRYCYYKETHKILGNTYGMCVLQDFEALTPNLLARTIETVEGGGVVALLLHSVTSLRQLYTLSMDVHARYRTEAHQHVVGRFNERFLLSLAACRTALVLDDRLDLLPLSSHALSVQPVPRRGVDEPLSPQAAQLQKLVDSLRDTQPVGALVACCRTLDQAHALLKFVDVLSERSLRATMSLTAARGRGKSAALGLALAAAVGFDYANVFVTSPSPENLRTLFEFVLKGFDAMDYQEHHDYEIVQSTNTEFNGAVIRVNVFRKHRQTIQYVRPQDAVKLSQAELVAIDEAAAIPLPLVKSLLGPYLVFMSSTINGYEGTGRSLSLKLLQQLRSQSAAGGTGSVGVTTSVKHQTAGVQGRSLVELSLTESIRYSAEDPVESWLNSLLCLDACTPSAAAATAGSDTVIGACPVPQDCDLYYISRDTLFSYHRAAETFLQRLMAIYVAAHYKNSPNDLQMLSDAPGHHLFCLLGPMPSSSTSGAGHTPVLPEILCVLQVCLEGAVSRDAIMAGLSRGRRAAGDLIPWNIAQQFQDNQFAQLSGARVVRIASHPDYHSMGYGSRALHLLHQYYEHKFPALSPLVEPAVGTVANGSSSTTTAAAAAGSLSGGETDQCVAPRAQLPPLLVRLHERPAEQLHYTGVSYGVTEPLLRFWKRAGYVPVYARQTANDLTGEHTCIMIRLLDTGDDSAICQKSLAPAGDSDVGAGGGDRWLADFFVDFRRRFVALLGYQFSAFPVSLALSMLDNGNVNTTTAVQSVSKATTGAGDCRTDGADGGATTGLISFSHIQEHISSYDLRRLELYANNMADYHLITDLLPPLARLCVLRRFEPSASRLSPVQTCLLIGLGLQHKTVDQLAEELGVAGSQLLGLFNRTVRRLTGCVRAVYEQGVCSHTRSGSGAAAAASSSKGTVSADKMVAAEKSVDEELAEAADELAARQRDELAKLKRLDLDEYAIRGSESEWQSALGAVNRKSTVLSVRTGEQRLDAPTGNGNAGRAPGDGGGDDDDDVMSHVVVPGASRGGKKRKYAGVAADLQRRLAAAAGGGGGGKSKKVKRKFKSSVK